jgi:hypothetical protein
VDADPRVRGGRKIGTQTSFNNASTPLNDRFTIHDSFTGKMLRVGMLYVLLAGSGSTGATG